MSWDIDTITSNTTPASTLREVLDDAISATSGWSFVESYTNALSDSFYIYSCTAGFYIALGYRADTPALLYWNIAEEWNASTKQFDKIAPAVLLVGTGNIPGAVGEFPENSAPSANRGSATDPIFSGVLGMNTTSFQYFYSISSSRIVVATSNSSQVSAPSLIYAGAFDSFVTGAASEFVIVAEGNTISQAAMVTRMPNYTTGSSANWRMTLEAHTRTDGQPGDVDPLHGSKIVLSRRRMYQNRDNAPRGLLRGQVTMTGSVSDNPYTFGDTFQVSGVDKYLISTPGNTTNNMVATEML